MAELVLFFITNIVGWCIFVYFLRDRRANGYAVRGGRAVLIGVLVYIAVLGFLLYVRDAMIRAGEEPPDLAELILSGAGLVPLMAMMSLVFPFVSSRRGTEDA